MEEYPKHLVDIRQQLEELLDERGDFDPRDYEIFRQGFIGMLRREQPLDHLWLLPAAIFLLSLVGVAYLLTTSESADDYMKLTMAVVLAAIFGAMTRGYLRETRRNKAIPEETRRRFVDELRRDGLLSDQEAQEVLDHPGKRQGDG